MNRRLFSRREKAILYLLAGGRCQSCSRLLPDDWHGDHKNPYSLGGETDLLNGQALCPPCNLRKGARMPKDPRKWQTEATVKWQADRKQDFLLMATPGAGKTRWSLTLAKQLLDSGEIDGIVVVVPTDGLRTQWYEAAAADLRLNLKPVSVVSDYNKVLDGGYDGVTCTYAQIAQDTGKAALRNLSSGLKLLFIVDEVHHAGESEAWGAGLREAAEFATYRLLLTGTPWRRNPKSPIPYVSYENDGTAPRVVTDYAYEYGDAVADGVCRRLEFYGFGGEARWALGSAKMTVNLTDVTREDVSNTWKVIVDPAGAWMPAMLAEADRGLDELRQEIPDAGGLVLADNKYLAQQYAQMLRGITGYEVSVVTSDDGDKAQGIIDTFRRGQDKWLVAVRMVSEGVDIKRLAVGVWATRWSTPLFFRQGTGRFVRCRDSDPVFSARIYMPVMPDLVQHAAEIETELRHTLQQLELDLSIEKKPRSEVDGDGRSPERPEFVSLGGELAWDRVIAAGAQLAPAEVTAAEQFCRDNAIPTMYAASVALGWRKSDTLVAQPAVEAVEDAPSVPRHKLETILRGEVDGMIGRIAYNQDIEKKELNREVYGKFGRRAECSVETLEALKDWLVERNGGEEP